MRTKILLPLFLLTLCVLHAEPTKMSRGEASELYSALASAEAGLTATHALAAADAIIVLRPHVEMLDKARIATQRNLQNLSASDPELAFKSQRLLQEFEQITAQEITVHLEAIDLTPEEITAAKLRPIHIAPIRRFMRSAVK